MYLAQYSNPGGDKAASLKDLEVVFGNLITVIMALVGIILFILLVSGGFRYLTAGGDPKAVEAAQKTLTYAIIGVVVVACAFLILRLIENFTGVPVTFFKITL